MARAFTYWIEVAASNETNGWASPSKTALDHPTSIARSFPLPIFITTKDNQARLRYMSTFRATANQ